MKNIYLVFLLYFVQNVIAQNSLNCNNSSGYDVILVAGQSNTHYGLSLDTKIDTVNSRVFTLRRSGGKDYRIEPATAVLDFWTRQTNRNSFAITFSNLYVENKIKKTERKVLIIPAGYAGSSIVNWSKGQNLYQDAISRVNYILNNIPGSRLVAILWHQGEANIGWQPYQLTLDKMISDMRTDINQENSNEIPFILGGMVPYWVNQNNNRKEQQKIIKETPLRVTNTSYADPEFPTVITKPNNNYDDIHFDAAGQREMGKRYFEAYEAVLNTELKLSINRYHEFNYFVNNSQNIPIDKIDIIANKTLKNVQVFDSNNNKVLEMLNVSSNTITIDVSDLPMQADPYKVHIVDIYDKTHDYKFYR